MFAKKIAVLTVALAMAMLLTTDAVRAQSGTRSKSRAKKESSRAKKKSSKSKPQGAPIRDEKHTFAKRVRDWKALKRRNIVMQKRDYSCGAAALATVAQYYWGDKLSEDYFLRILDKLLTVEEAQERVENGLAMSDLRRAAVKAGYAAVVGKVSFDKLAESKVPLIVGITVNDFDHFVVYRGTDGVHVYLADPIRGNLRIRSEEFIKQWQKNAVLAIAKPGRQVKKYSPLSIRADELFLGELNDQVIRTASERPTTRPAKPRKAAGVP